MDLKLDVSGEAKTKIFLAGVAKQIPFATSVAINNTAFDVRKAEQEAIGSAFDNPLAWTKRAPRVEKSNKRRLIARVYLDESTLDVLAHHVEGGPRVPRDVVANLRRKGVMRAGEYTTYAPGYVNARGNITLGRWRKILAEVGRKGGQYFVATIRGTKAIWIRKGRGGRSIAPVVYITSKRPKYSKRLPFYETAERTLNRVYQRHFDQALDRAIRTAR